MKFTTYKEININTTEEESRNKEQFFSSQNEWIGGCLGLCKRGKLSQPQCTFVYPKSVPSRFIKILLDMCQSLKYLSLTFVWFVVGRSKTGVLCWSSSLLQVNYKRRVLWTRVSITLLPQYGKPPLFCTKSARKFGERHSSEQWAPHSGLVSGIDSCGPVTHIRFTNMVFVTPFSFARPSL